MPPTGAINGGLLEPRVRAGEKRFFKQVKSGQWRLLQRPITGREQRRRELS